MATPIEHAWREYAAFLRGPVGLNTFGFGTVDAYRAGVQHVGLLQVFPEPSDSSVDDFGIQRGGGFTVEIADEPDDADWFWLWDDGSRILWDDGERIILEY